MSGQNRLTTEQNARILIDDLDAAAYGVTSERLHEIVKHEAQRVARAVGLGAAWVSNALTLTTGTRDYTFSTSFQYASISHLILDSRNWILQRVPLDVINASYQGFAPFGNAKGVPYRYAMWEDSNQTVNVRIWPSAVENDTVTAFLSKQQIVLAADSDNLPFSNDLLRAVEKAVAVKMWKSMPEPKRHVSPEFVKDLEMESADGISQERIRLNRLKRTSAMALTEA